MKNITFFFLLLMVSFGYSQTVLEDFEGAVPTTENFDGISSSTQSNPDQTGSNTSANALELITGAAGQPWQGAKLFMQTNKIDMTTADKTMTVDVYSTAPREFMAKLSDSDAGGADPAQDSKTAAAHTGSGWETLTFDFNVGADTTQPGYNPPNDQFASIVFYPLYDISNNGWCDGCGFENALATTTYIDNVSALEGDLINPLETCDDGILNNGETEIDCGGLNCAPCAGTPEILEDFEGTAPTTEDFDGIASSTQTNPDQAGPNMSANALELITGAAGQPWQGAKLFMQTNKIDMTTADKTMTVDVYSTAPREFMAKLSDSDAGGADPTQDSKTAAAHTGSGWETLTFDFNVGADTTQPGYNPPNDQFASIVFYPLYDISNNGWCDGCGFESALATTTYIDNVSGLPGDLINPPETCDDGILNNGETEIDCGGLNCAPCAGTPEILEDFEGTAPTTEDFDGIASSTQINPDQAGPNMSANALELITGAAGQPWQGAKLFMQTNKIDMTTADKTMTVDVYSTAPREFMAKLSDSDAGGADPALDSKTAAAHTGSGWETLTFDFNVGADTTQPGYNPPNDQFASIVFYPLYDISNNGWCDGCGFENALATTTYIDNVTGLAGDLIPTETCSDGILNNGETEIDCGGPNCDSCPEEPMDAPPTPPARAATDVISIYGEAYGVDIGLNNVPWDGATNFEEEVIASNKVLKVDIDSFMGSDLGSVVDATGMTHFHIDYWISDEFEAGQVFNIKWSNHAEGAGETDAGELPISFSGSSDVQNWISVDVPLSDFNNVVGGGIDNRAALTQFLISTAGLTKIAYIDNIYLHKDTTLSNEEFNTAEFKVYPNPTATNWTISGNSTITKVTVYDILGQKVSVLVSNDNEVIISTMNMSSGMYFAKIESDNGSQTVKLIKE